MGSRIVSNRQKVQVLRDKCQKTYDKIDVRIRPFAKQTAHEFLIALDELLADWNDPADDGPEVDILRQTIGNAVSVEGLIPSTPLKNVALPAGGGFKVVHAVNIPRAICGRSTAPAGWWCSRDAFHEGPCAARRCDS